MTSDEVRDGVKEMAIESGFDLTDEQAERLLAEHPNVEGEYRLAGPCDTVTRETLDEAIALTFVGLSWPTYGDGPGGWGAFAAKVREAAKAGKVKIVDEMFEGE
jgi:hypothetical protein